MFDAVVQWLSDNYPLIFIGIIIAVVVWLVARFYYTRFVMIQKEMEKTINRINKLPCPNQQTRYELITQQLSTIITYLQVKDSKAAAIFSQKASPRKLNEEGIALFNDCGGQEFLDENKDELIESIAAKDPATALDVESIALVVLIARLESDIFNKLKQWVYNSPSRKINVHGEEKEYTVSMSDICFVISIPLRDLYLDMHPDIK